MGEGRRYLQGVMSGECPGTAAHVLRTMLAAAEPFYLAAVALRNRWYDRASAATRVDSPVISVGNLTTGGTGKTPVVAWVVEQLRRGGARPAILSRGYRALPDGENDEKRLLDRLCPGVPHLQNPDRIASARQAIASYGADVLVLDDGFQHRRLHRDLDIVLIDALNPWGYGRLLPRGLLREPCSSLRRAQVVIITRADLCSSGELLALHNEVRRHTDAKVAHAAFRPTHLVNAAGETASLLLLAEQRVAAFCGIGNPAGFQSTLEAMNQQCAAKSLLAFPDHHHYGTADVARLAAHERRAGLLLTTEKDIVKFSTSDVAGRPLWAVRLGVELTHAAFAVEDAVNRIVHGRSCMGNAAATAFR